MPRKAMFTREHIIKSALDLVRKEGISSLKARELGAFMGSSPRPIFTIFESMDQVQQEVFLAATRYFRDYVSDAVNYKPAFKQYAILMLHFAKEEPWLFDLIFAHKDGPSFEDDPTALACIDFMKHDYQLTDQEALVLFRQMWIFGMGLCIYWRKNDFATSEPQLNEMLGRAFLSTLTFIKRNGTQLVVVKPQTDTEHHTIPIEQYPRQNNTKE